MFGRYLWMVHLAIVVAFSYLLADLISVFIGRNLEAIPQLPPPAELVQPAQVRPPADLSAAILDRNIFGLKPQPTAALLPQAPSAPSAPPPLAPLRLRLIGTVVDDAGSLAILEDLATREQLLYREGDPIAGDGRLSEIRRNEVVVARGKIRETLEVTLDEAGALATMAPVALPPPVATARPAPEASEGNYRVLDKNEVQAALENLPQLLTKARVVPYMTAEGKADGFRIVSIAPNSFYERIGLRNGDVLQRINGIEIKDPETFMRVFNQLKEESNIALDLVRRNQKETLNYEIR